ncbi:MAG TPA: hypothetical protein VKY25_03850 [Erysipelothrix sp.]|nr:hypothetical protein [Erysipelothrix sp.]
MAYEVTKLETKPTYVASMRMTIPEYSTALTLRAVKTLRKELRRKGIQLSDPQYNFVIAYDSPEKLEVIDVEVFVSVENMGPDSQMIKFTTLPAEQAIIRVKADVFEDVHIALAEWMHDHNYEADGVLRTIIHDGDDFIYDCPVKPSED